MRNDYLCRYFFVKPVNITDMYNRRWISSKYLSHCKPKTLKLYRELKQKLPNTFCFGTFNRLFVLHKIIFAFLCIRNLDTQIIRKCVVVFCRQSLCITLPYIHTNCVMFRRAVNISKCNFKPLLSAAVAVNNLL